MLMSYSGLAAAAALIVSLTAVPLAAQSQLRPPAELPPAGYAGTQYVDSRGCVYIRAGNAGQVSWVPRVTRDRKPVCGFQPTLAVAPAPERRAAPASEGVDVAAPAAPRQNAVAPARAGVGTVVTPQTASAKGVGPRTRVLPRHLYEQRRALPPVTVPKGYRTAWDDDRLNPRRAEQTLQGHSEMRKVWSATVPRQLREER